MRLRKALKAAYDALTANNGPGSMYLGMHPEKVLVIYQNALKK